MNVNLSWETNTLNTLVLEDQLLPNAYNIRVHFVTNTTNTQEQKIVFDRVKLILETQFNFSCIASYDSPSFNVLKDHFSQSICQIGSEASDLIIGAILFRKIHKIVDKKLILNGLEISSQLGGMVGYTLTGEDFIQESTIHPWTTGVPWWERNDPSINDLQDDKINEISWKDMEMELPSDAVIVKKFTPTVIEGGKDEK